ncbi:hypothetical protein LCGC14_0376440, partial [marine sediment metagenome]
KINASEHAKEATQHGKEAGSLLLTE